VEPLRTQGLDHVAITVEDLARSRRFYMDVIGLEPKFEEGHEPAFMLSHSSGLALFSRRSYPGTGADGVPDLRVMHIAFRIARDEFDRARAELPSLGIDPRYEDHGSVHSIYFRDPDGHQIELTTDAV
jgi:catechol 2,3-dioxygenase-like lactoylglutathione lyase family enzyme